MQINPPYGFKELVEKGVLGCVYLHLVLPDNIQLLLARRAAGPQATTAGKPGTKKHN